MNQNFELEGFVTDLIGSSVERNFIPEKKEFFRFDRKSDNVVRNLLAGLTKYYFESGEILEIRNFFCLKRFNSRNFFTERTRLK